MPESTSLYRRHRPRSFADVVGQEHVVRTLKGAVENDKVHHAYLFVGSRGTGKTSMAKILARSLNCVNGPTATPCGACDSCVSIANGSSLDVIEMDAASNRSVDDIRELRERVGYAPAAGHWKVYILDEAHMLTKEAWNAFLKTLEEPPPHTVFVLATTEPQKVMATIVDRCQRFDFQRPSLEQLSEVITRASGAEGFQVEDGAVALISRAAGGSFRDALGTLDQIVSYGGTNVTTQNVLDVLGAADADLLFDAVDGIAAGDARQVLGVVDRLAKAGRDASTFTRDLISHLRQLIVVRVTGEMPDSFSVTVSDPERMKKQAADVPESSLIAAIDALSEALAGVREGDDPRLSLEVALLKVARPSLDPSREALLRRIERLESGAGAPAAPGWGGDADSGESGATNASEASGEGRDSSTEAASPPPPDPKPVPAPAGSLGDIAAVWPAVIEHLNDSGSHFLSSVFAGARPLGLEEDGRVIRIGFPATETFNKRKAESKPNVEKFGESLRAILGRPIRPVYELLDPDHQDEEGKELSEDELVNLLMTEFDASEVFEDDEQRSAHG